jgi:hypothetical protein
LWEDLSLSLSLSHTQAKKGAYDRFSQMQNLKNSNPELATTEIAKKLGERWQKMTGNIL